MQRSISGYHQDQEGDWVAELSCGHDQHVRHRPPFQLREWVLDSKGREARRATPIDCPLCDRAELPDGLRLIQTSPQWDERTMPPGLTRSHRTPAGTWGRIVVHDGSLHCVALGEPGLNVFLRPGSTQALPPGVEHYVEPLDRVRFSIDFLSISEKRSGRSAMTAKEALEQGGETACWAHLICPECGVVLDGGRHLEGCDSAKGG